MSFDKALAEALEVIPLGKIDKRLKTQSKLGMPTSRLRKSKQASSLAGPTLPSPVFTNLRREKLPLSDDIMSEQVTDEDLPPREEAAPTEAASTGEVVPGLPSGSKYTLSQAKGQLDGIIKFWMDLAGNYPEGEQRHKFLEIGERLREISAVLNRDFLGG